MMRPTGRRQGRSSTAITRAPAILRCISIAEVGDELDPKDLDCLVPDIVYCGNFTYQTQDS